MTIVAGDARSRKVASGFRIRSRTSKWFAPVTAAVPVLGLRRPTGAADFYLPEKSCGSWLAKAARGGDNGLAERNGAVSGGELFGAERLNAPEPFCGGGSVLICFQENVATGALSPGL